MKHHILNHVCHLWCCCPEFAYQSVSARRSFVSEKLLCFNCLRPAHKAVNWKLKKRCQECNKSHNTLFHENTPTVNEESDQRPVVVLTRAGDPEPEPERGAMEPANFWRSRSWSRSLFKYFCGAGAGAGAKKILLAPAPVMVHRINFIE